MMKRAADGEHRWVGTMFPTNAHAADAEMSLADFEDFYFRACLADDPDPLGAWKRASEECHRLAEWIEGREEVRIVAEGTDLTLGIAGRHFIPCDGEHNMPDGEFFTGPVEDSVEGEVTLPPAGDDRRPRGRRRAAAVRGAARSSTRRAERGEEYLISMLDTDEGARRLGELGIGTNFGIERGHPLDPARREDRRHGPPRGRRELPGVGRRQRERRPHRHGLRPAPGRAGSRSTARCCRRTARSPSETLEEEQ